MAADIYTKGFTDPQKWELVCGRINVFDPKVLASRPEERKKFQLLIDNSTSQSGGIRRL